MYSWNEQSRLCRLYVALVCFSAVPFTFFCFKAANLFSLQWFFLSLVSLFVATVNVRLPRLSVVISMGDVFILVILMQFGPGPALVTYWLDTATATFADLFRRYGIRLLPELFEHLNPMPYAAAVQMEKDLAEDLRQAGYTVTGGY